MHVNELPVNDAPIILAGDFNVAREPKDIYNTKSYDENALIQPEARIALAEILDVGFSDAQRLIDTEIAAYTFCDYRRNRWKRNAGLRLDLFLLSRRAADMLNKIEVDTQPRNWPEASDHAPVQIELE